VAKKGRRRTDEEAEEHAFEFPVFDEKQFASKEFELTGSVAVAGAVAVLLGGFAWFCTSLGLAWYIPFPLAFLAVVLSPLFLDRLRPGRTIFTKGDWAGILALEFFGFLAAWFVLVNAI
jgi:hypothetical protein